MKAVKLVQRTIASLLFSMAVLLPWVAPAGAATLKSVELSGNELRVSLDAAVPYQVYELDAPSRLVLSFPGVKLGSGVHPLAGAGFVKQVFPAASGKGVRLEMTLSGEPEYTIDEKGADLVVRFSGTGGTAQKASAGPQGAVITDLEARDVGEVTELVFRGQNLDVNHNSYLTNDGRTLIIDFWGGSSKLAREHFSYATQRVASVDVGEAEGRLRVVAKLLPTANVQQNVEAHSDRMIVRIGQIRPARSMAAVRVEDVNFRPDDRIAHIIVRTDKANPIFNITQEGRVVAVDVSNATLAPGKERSLDVSAFPGPVRQVDSYVKGDKVRIVARLRDDVEVTSFQSGNVLTINLEPKDLALAKRGTAEGEKIPYTGQRVTFDFKDIDIRNALKLIAEMSDLNIIMSDDVTGTLTMRLVDVPWDQALDLILTARGLGKEKIGNVVRIAPLSVLQADAEAKSKALLSVEDVAPLETEFIKLGYASVNDVKTILEGGSVKEQAAAAGGAAGKGAKGAAASAAGKGGLKLLSKRGSILLDERSNMLIITDTRERLNNIKRLIAMIDKPVQQVMIESRIVEASDSFSRDLGVQWGGVYSEQGNKFTHTINGNNLNGFAVDLPAANTTSLLGYTLGTLSGVVNLNLQISAAEAEGKVKVISSPRVYTSNLQEAIIEQDTQIPFAQTTFAGGVATTATTTQSAKLTLKVTPQITADKRIIMELEVNKDTPKQNTLSTSGEPIIDKKKVKTKLLVKNGETVVLGGIYSQTISENEGGVPFFRHIPLLGPLLFENHSKSDTRNELLIFITPTIISGEENQPKT